MHERRASENDAFKWFSLDFQGEVQIRITVLPQPSLLAYKVSGYVVDIHQTPTFSSSSYQGSFVLMFGYFKLLSLIEA